MKKFFKGIVLPFLLLLSTVSWTQDKTITGRVVDESGAGAAGASVAVKGSTAGTLTNDKGDFTLSVPPSASILVISFTGYGTKEVTVAGNMVSVSLVKSISNLDEVVVVGYGTQRKVNVTGAISTVKAKDLENI